MTNTALIADDDPSVRSMLGRLLTSLDWTVIEAADGCSALEKLHGNQVDLVVLDHRMPQLSGLEVLNVLRRSREHADVAVIVVSGAAEANISEEFLRMGVSDYLVKPLRLDFVRDRLARLDRIVRAATPARRGDSRSMAREAATVMVVDADAEFRSFVSTMLTPRYQVFEATSAISALRACVMARPSIFLVGQDVGLIPPEFLALKLRERREFAQAQILYTGAKRGDATPEHFDGVLPRTFVPDTFSASFSELFGRSFDDDRDPLAAIRRTVESATEQAVGMMATTALQMTRGDASLLTGDQMQASVDLAIDNGRTVIRLALRGAPNHVKVFAGQMLGMAPDDVSDEDALSTLGELTNVIAGRVKTSVVNRGESADMALPEMTVSPEDEPPQPADVILRFSPEGNDQDLLVLLRLPTRTKRRATQPAQGPVPIPAETVTAVSDSSTAA